MPKEKRVLSRRIVVRPRTGDNILFECESYFLGKPCAPSIDSLVGVDDDGVFLTDGEYILQVNGVRYITVDEKD